jgi:hypothetical protein
LGPHSIQPGERDDEVGRPRRLAHDGVRARQRDSHPARVKAPRHGVGQPGQQPAELLGLLQLAAERREQPVAVDPRAEHPPVGPPLQPSPQRLESQGGHDRDQHRRLDGDLRAERETRRRRQHDVDARDPHHQRGVDDRPAHGDVDVVEAVLQDADHDGQRDGGHQRHRERVNDLEGRAAERQHAGEDRDHHRRGRGVDHEPHPPPLPAVDADEADQQHHDADDRPEVAAHDGLDGRAEPGQRFHEQRAGHGRRGFEQELVGHEVRHGQQEQGRQRELGPERGKDPPLPRPLHHAVRVGAEQHAAQRHREHGRELADEVEPGHPPARRFEEEAVPQRALDGRAHRERHGEQQEPPRLEVVGAAAEQPDGDGEERDHREREPHQAARGPVGGQVDHRVGDGDHQRGDPDRREQPLPGVHGCMVAWGSWARPDGRPPAPMEAGLHLTTAARPVLPRPRRT